MNKFFVTDVEKYEHDIRMKMACLDDFYETSIFEITVFPVMLKPSDDCISFRQFVDSATDIMKARKPMRDANVKACVRNNERISYSFARELICFDDYGMDELVRLLNLIESQEDDTEFILVYKQTTSSVGLMSYTCPHLLVMDRLDTIQLYNVQWSANEKKFVKVEITETDDQSSVRKYQLSDISDGLTVGSPFTANEMPNIKNDIEWVQRRVNEILKISGLSGMEDHVWHYLTEEVADLLVEKLNAIPAERWRFCRKCNKHFLISDSEIEWFKQKEFKLPNKCGSCRAIEKEERRRDDIREYYRHEPVFDDPYDPYW